MLLKEFSFIENSVKSATFFIYYYYDFFFLSQIISHSSTRFFKCNIFYRRKKKEGRKKMQQKMFFLTVELFIYGKRHRKYYFCIHYYISSLLLFPISPTMCLRAEGNDNLHYTPHQHSSCNNANIAWIKKRRRKIHSYAHNDATYKHDFLYPYQ